jgi:hypothetical protein
MLFGKNKLFLEIGIRLLVAIPSPHSLLMEIWGFGFRPQSPVPS